MPDVWYRFRTLSSIDTLNLNFTIKLSKMNDIFLFISTEEPPRLTRTKTTVSTDYQFSACYLTQLGTSFNYDYEYHGPSMRLVLTPLTERAFLSLTQAIKNFHCGTLVGPSGVGKSETVKELAKVTENI